MTEECINWNFTFKGTEVIKINFIDFHVTEIISEEKGLVYELYGMTVDLVEKEEEWYKKILFSNGIKQTYKYWDEGEENIRTEVFVVGRDSPYFVGYVGQHWLIKTIFYMVIQVKMDIK